MQRNSFNNLQNLNSHEHHCENLMFMRMYHNVCMSTCGLHCSGHTLLHAMDSVNHPLVDLDQCPLDFLVLSPFKTNRFESDEVMMVVQ